LFGEDVTEFRMQVYDRWGQLVFQTNDIRKGWDGRVNGWAQSNGTFVWIIRFRTITDSREQLMKGTVMLIR